MTLETFLGIFLKIELSSETPFLNYKTESFNIRENFMTH